MLLPPSWKATTRPCSTYYLKLLNFGGNLVTSHQRCPYRFKRKKIALKTPQSTGLFFVVSYKTFMYIKITHYLYSIRREGEEWEKKVTPIPKWCLCMSAKTPM